MNPTRDTILARLGESSSPVSGDLLAQELGLSRAAIWKHIQNLRKQGIDIESLAGRGYRLQSDVLSPAMLCARLSRKEHGKERGQPGDKWRLKRLGAQIVVLDETDSTNRDVMRQAEAGAAEGLVIIADRQREGRGRLGRSWHTAGHDALAISVLLRPQLPPQQVPQLSLLTAVALHQAVAKYVAEVRIKWPNDLLCHGAKMAGILTEMRAEPGRVHAVVLGVGLNIRQPAGGWPPAITQQVTALCSETALPVSRLDIAAEFITALDRCYDIFLSEGFAPIRGMWWQAHAASGRMVRAHGHEGYVEGIAEALDEDGALLLRVEGKLQRFIAGDLELINTEAMGSPA